MITGNTSELDEAIRSKILPYLYNGGEGKWIHCAHLACLRNRDRPKSKQFDEIKVNIVKLKVMSLDTFDKSLTLVILVIIIIIV